MHGLAAVIDRSEPVRNEDACALLLLQNTADILEKSLFGMCVQCRSLTHHVSAPN